MQSAHRTQSCQLIALERQLGRQMRHRVPALDSSISRLAGVATRERVVAGLPTAQVDSALRHTRQHVSSCSGNTLLSFSVLRAAPRCSGCACMQAAAAVAAAAAAACAALLTTALICTAVRQLAGTACAWKREQPNLRQVAAGCLLRGAPAVAGLAQGHPAQRAGPWVAGQRAGVLAAALLPTGCRANTAGTLPCTACRASGATQIYRLQPAHTDTHAMNNARTVLCQAEPTLELERLCTVWCDASLRASQL